MPVKAPITSLKFKASTIARAEERFKMDFFSSLDKLGTSMSAMLFLFCAGGGDDESFDKLMEEEGMKGLAMLVLDGINRAGFLGFKFDLKAIGESIDKELAKAAKELGVSLNTGETAKD